MNLIKQAGQALATFAPTIATALGGPLAGVAVDSLEKVFGIDPNASAQTKQAAIEQGLTAATPDQIIALRRAEDDFQVQMKQLGISEEKLAYDDTANARAREIAVRDSTPRVLAYGTTVGFFLALLGLNLMPIPAENRATIYSMVGSLGTVWILVMGYYFGSSRGSDDKTKALTEIAKQP